MQLQSDLPQRYRRAIGPRTSVSGSRARIQAITPARHCVLLSFWEPPMQRMAQLQPRTRMRAERFRHAKILEPRRSHSAWPLLRQTELQQSSRSPNGQHSAPRRRKAKHEQRTSAQPNCPMKRYKLGFPKGALHSSCVGCYRRTAEKMSTTHTLKPLEFSEQCLARIEQ